MEINISIRSHNGNQVVSAREVYDILNVKTKFTTWFKRMLTYGFSEGREWVPINETLENTGFSGSGTPKVDYAITLDMAKEIGMIQRSPEGKALRQHFIEREKKLQSVEAGNALQKAPPPPATKAEALLHAVQMMVEQERRVSAVEADVLELKAATKTRPEYYTVVGYGVTVGINNISLQLASKVGQKARKLCRQKGYDIDTIPDPRFGKVNMYPKSVLKEAFDQSMT